MEVQEKGVGKRSGGGRQDGYEGRSGGVGSIGIKKGREGTVGNNSNKLKLQMATVNK